MSKQQLFNNSSYICLCGATLMACELWKVVFIMDIEKSKMNQTKFQYQSLV